jgi:hypothetical protein
MPLTKPTLTEVSPGEPVTAQGWNTFVTGLSALYDAVLALGGGTLDVAVTAGGNPLPAASVVAEPVGEGRPVAALPPFGTRTTHLLAGLTDGSWRVHVEAPGFKRTTAEVTMPRTDPLAVALEIDGVAVRDLFGVGARAALDQVRADGIDVDVLLDTTGREVSRTALPPEYVESPVLFQLPEAGTVVPTGTGRVKLVVASALRRDPVVVVPSLIGLSQDEAAASLEAVGLRLGKVTGLGGRPEEDNP